MKCVELCIDVTKAAALGKPAETAVSVYLPDGELANPPVVCLAFPGGGYCRRYYSFDMPDSSAGGEAAFHCARGWIFVACDHLGFGDSTIPDGNELDYESIAHGNNATVSTVIEKLESGTMLAGYPRVIGATKVGIGQSMGGCFTIVAQAHLNTFDGVGILGFSGIHTVAPARPGASAAVWPWAIRGGSLDKPKILNQAALTAAGGSIVAREHSAAAVGENPLAWCFHYDDEPADIVALDMCSLSGREGSLPEWRSATIPSCWIYMLAPGAVATEAACITVPVLVAVGERDLVPDPWMEPKAYKSSNDISIFVCPRMAHMHNFAHTRWKFWQRIHSWGTGVAEGARQIV